MLVRQEVFSTERLAAMLTLERQEVDQVAKGSRALLSDSEEMGVTFGSGGGRAGHGGSS